MYLTVLTIMLVDSVYRNPTNKPEIDPDSEGENVFLHWDSAAHPGQGFGPVWFHLKQLKSHSQTCQKLNLKRLWRVGDFSLRKTWERNSSLVYGQIFSWPRFFPCVLKDPTSQEIMYSKAVQAAKPASRRRTAADETIKRWVQNQGSEETTDPDSEEDNSPPRVQAVHPSRMAESTTVPDSGSKEPQDMDSLEDNGGSPAPADNRGDSGYKGTGLLKESLATVPGWCNEAGFHSNLQEAENCWSQTGLQQVSMGPLWTGWGAASVISERVFFWCAAPSENKWRPSHPSKSQRAWPSPGGVQM